MADKLTQALHEARMALLEERSSRGIWEGELSASALSTATAAVALTLAERFGAVGVGRFSSHIARALDWLAVHQNPDGGWGDTIYSHSNISTTVLAWAALGALASGSPAALQAAGRAERWLTSKVGSCSPDELAQTLLRRYGSDRTFSVPILTHCALCGRLGEGAEAWRHVMALPFEIAACPAEWFATLRMPVVSYALPALIAIGYARHAHAPSSNPLLRKLRQWSTPKVLRVLDAIQPPNGGFLEATPLTSFVVMSLVASGQQAHPVVRRGLEFLERSAQADGSWRIDTNLATWMTTLSVSAMAGGSLAGGAIDDESSRDAITHWLLGQQYRTRHVYTNAAPGGWAWTDLPGGVPDADDTAGALLALRALTENDSAVDAAAQGATWLLDLQNRDGGIPTFCRGWGHLPFDKSSADITAHVLRAWHAWRAAMPEGLQARIARGIARALGFLERSQGPDGTWTPLWFGNQFEPDEANRVYGTSRVLLALADTTGLPGAAQKGAAWLVRAQKSDGGWSGGLADAPASTEETALALEALAAWHQKNPSVETAEAMRSGTEWLCARVRSGEWRTPAPIGFYFAKLWYFERLYPLIFTAAALERVRACDVNGTTQLCAEA